MAPYQILFDQIPVSEDENFEFKSSRLSENKDKFAEKLSAALSGFANSGGGFFIVGIDDNTGLVDGGINEMIGRQSLSDWIDTIAHRVQPVPQYFTYYIDSIFGRGNLNKNKIVLIVRIEESNTGPHMAQDDKYYIRAGAHTVPAKHFIIEAIRTKRYHSKPKLTHLFRLKPNQEKILQLGILALTDAPAINVSIQLTPIPESFEGRENDFPINVSLIDQKNPFYFDVSLFASSNKAFGNDILLDVNYEDLINNKYNYNSSIGVDNSTQPILIGNDYQEKISKTLEEIKNVLSRGKSNKRFDHPYVPIIINDDRDMFSYVKNILPELIDEMRVDSEGNPFKREFILRKRSWIYDSDPNNEVLEYYFESHTDLRAKIRILENCGFVYNVSFNDIDRFVMTELFVQRLTS